MTTLEELVKRYKAHADSWNDMEKAKVEQEIWEAYLEVPGRPPVSKDRKSAPVGSYARRDDYLKDILDIPRTSSQNRQTLMNGLPASQPLWDLVLSKKMLLETASTILKVARRLTVAENIAIEDAIQEALDEYDSRPYLIFVGGVPVRRGKPVRSKTPEEKKVEAKKVRASSKTSEGRLLGQIRADVLAYLEGRAANIEPILKEKLLGEFAVAVKVVVEEFRHKMARLVDDADEVTRAAHSVSRRDVILACETLHMDPPAPGHPVDITKAKKQKKMLAREYHPDLHEEKVKSRMEEVFQGVLAAFSIIEQYNEQVSPTGKGDSSAGKRAEGGGVRG